MLVPFFHFPCAKSLHIHPAAVLFFPLPRSGFQICVGFGLSRGRGMPSYAERQRLEERKQQKESLGKNNDAPKHVVYVYGNAIMCSVRKKTVCCDTWLACFSFGSCFSLVGSLAAVTLFVH